MKKISFKGLLILSLIIFSMNFAIAQENCTNCTGKTTKPTVTALPKQAKNFTVLNDEDNIHPFQGTFQVVSLLGDNKIENFTTNYILSLVEKNRKSTEDVEIKLSEFTKLRIPSTKKIKSADFQPFAELYSFE